MITLEDDSLVFRFPQVHERARFSIDFQRTLRLPDDDRRHPLPPGLGRFPLRHLDDLAARLPEASRARGGVILPIWQAEALWLNFDCPDRWELPYPFAIKVAAGKINAVTGEPWAGQLNTDPQDYMAVPGQPWLDGYCVRKGEVRQFVAMPLGEGYSAEEQLTGRAEVGGLQIMAFPMKAERYEAMRREWEERRRPAFREVADFHLGEFRMRACRAPMALAPGGRMRQEIHEDPHGLDAWDQRHAARVFVTLADAAQWLALTGARPPQEPPTAQDYARARLPWFDHYRADLAALEGAERLAGLTPLAQMSAQKGAPLPGNASLPDLPVRPLGDPRPGRPVREAGF